MKKIIKLFICVSLWVWLLACILLKDSTDYGVQGDDVEYIENYYLDHSEYLIGDVYEIN